MIIAMDGPAGAGKSTVARAVADKLNIAFLDTGAMYRAVTLVMLQRGLNPLDDAAAIQVANQVNLSFGADGLIRIDGVAGEPDIRSATVTLNVSAVSAHKGVRDAVVALQRQIGEASQGLVVEGRDTATVVFPEAEYKFFLDASPLERAQRRARQEHRMNELEMIQRDIERRDRLDTTRAHAPLRQAEGATLINTDGKSIATVVHEILEYVEAGATDRGDIDQKGVEA
ncbi:MAG: cytidylate kinase [Planctomycetota bacterium]|jgi:cytidylate kinase